MPSNDEALIHPLIDTGIFELLGLTSISKEKKNELALVMMETIQGRITDRLLAEVTPARGDEFEKVLDKGGDSLKTYLQELNIDFDQMAAEEIVFYKAELAGSINRSAVPAS